MAPYRLLSRSLLALTCGLAEPAGAAAQVTPAPLRGDAPADAVTAAEARKVIEAGNAAWGKARVSAFNPLDSRLGGLLG